MTAEFPDTSQDDLAERRAQLQEEFDGLSLADLEEERARREDQLERAIEQCSPVEIRVYGNRLVDLRAEIEWRGHRQNPRAG